MTKFQKQIAIAGALCGPTVLAVVFIQLSYVFRAAPAPSYALHLSFCVTYFGAVIAATILIWKQYREPWPYKVAAIVSYLAISFLVTFMTCGYVAAFNGDV